MVIIYTDGSYRTNSKENIYCTYGMYILTNGNLFISVSDPDTNPDPVGSAFNLSLDPGSGSVFGILIRIPDQDV
jgi:hypothetical protein